MDEMDSEARLGDRRSSRGDKIGGVSQSGQEQIDYGTAGGETGSTEVQSGQHSVVDRLTVCGLEMQREHQKRVGVWVGPRSLYN